MKYIKEPNWSDDIPIPLDVAKCPVCGKQLTVNPSGWRETGGMAWACDSFETSCPDMDEESHDYSYQMPYVYWLPVDDKIEKWLFENYRFVEGEK